MSAEVESSIEDERAKVPRLSEDEETEIRQIAASFAEFLMALEDFSRDGKKDMTLGAAKEELTAKWRNESKEGRRNFFGKCLHAILKLMERYAGDDSVTIEVALKDVTDSVARAYERAAFPTDYKGQWIFQKQDRRDLTEAPRGTLPGEKPASTAAV